MQCRLRHRAAYRLSFILLAFPVNGSGQPYEPPIGIPAPAFGIEQSVENIYGAGYYTHYIDNTDPNATDDSNPSGTAERPRLTIPRSLTDLPPGCVVEIRGGPYRFNAYTQWTAAGTLDRPVFIRGADPGPPETPVGRAAAL